MLLDNVTSEELIFEGDFTGVGVNYLWITHSIKFTGNSATFNGVSFFISADDVVVDGFILNQSDYALFMIDGYDNVTLSNNVINFTALEGHGSYAIYASCVNDFKLINNNITYTGNTDGTDINNALIVTGSESSEIAASEILIQGNNFDIKIPSVPVYYDPDTYEATTMSEGIVFYYCEDVQFVDNRVELQYNNASGLYDTIYVISLRGNPYNMYSEDPIICSDILIKDNTIVANGHGYIYGIFSSADVFEISGNTLNIASDYYYANGIDIEGPSSEGYVSNNNLLVSAPEVAYGIYSAEFYGAVEEIEYNGNTVFVDSYASCGMELIERYSMVENNLITAYGNYTYGIVASIRVGEASILNNDIACEGSNVGTNPISDSLLPLNSMGISVKGDVEIVGNNISSTNIGVNIVKESYIVLDNNNIEVAAVGNISSYAIYSNNASDITITNNYINYTGNTDGTFVNNAMLITGDEYNEHIVSDIIVRNNVFDILIPSVPVYYDPDTYEPTVMSEGIVFYYCEDVEFSGNNVTLYYSEASGDYNTIYVVSVRGNPYNFDAEDPIACANVAITNNRIIGYGHEYIYGIRAAAHNLQVSGNELSISSDYYYADGIDIEGPSNGVVTDNSLSIHSEGAAYGIYSSFYDAAVEEMEYSGNTICVDGYAACGMELIEINPVISNNEIIATGNYTYGIVASIRDDVGIFENNITCLGSNEGTLPTGDSLLHKGSFGISVNGLALVQYNDIESTDIGLYSYKANLTAMNNVIKAQGDYAVDLYQSNATLTDNYISSKKGVGNAAITGEKIIAASGNGPSLKTVLSAVNLYTVYMSGDVFYVTAKDENGDPIKNVTIFLETSERLFNVTTDEDGLAIFMIDDWDADDYIVEIYFEGDGTYGPKKITSFISISPEVSQIVAPESATYLITAVKNGAYYTILLKDVSDNALYDQKVTITFNGKTATYTTDITGIIKYKIEATKVGTQKLIVSFDSNDNYISSTLTATIKITKEATKLTAAKKTFKAKVKTKKYTVTLKDSKGKAIKKVKLTLKIKGKTYKATTNAKGKATFKIKKLTKKGKYSAKVSFAGNNLYNKVAKSVKITVK